MDLNRRCNHILEALAILAADYEAAHMLSMAADLWNRLEHYRGKGDVKSVVIEERNRAERLLEC